MATVTITKQLAAPAASVWALLSDFGNVDWIPTPGRVDVEGSGPGMRRIIRGSDGAAIVETLQWVAAECRELAYEIGNNPLPVSRFEAVVSVTDGEPGARTCTVTWRVDYDPTGDDAAARGGIEMIYTAMAGWLSEAAQPTGSKRV
jgi:hypothetical protein